MPFVPCGTHLCPLLGAASFDIPLRQTVTQPRVLMAANGWSPAVAADDTHPAPDGAILVTARAVTVTKTDTLLIETP